MANTCGGTRATDGHTVELLPSDVPELLVGRGHQGLDPLARREVTREDLARHHFNH